MPYKIVKEDDKYIVRKKEDNKLIGTHDSREKAKKQIAAIYANKKAEYTAGIHELIKKSNLNPEEALQLLGGVSDPTQALQLLNNVSNLGTTTRSDYNEIIKNKLWNFIDPAILEKDLLLESDLNIGEEKPESKFIENALEYELYNYFANRALTNMRTDLSPDILEQLAQLQHLNEMEYLSTTPSEDMTADDILNTLGGLTI